MKLVRFQLQGYADYDELEGKQANHMLDLMEKDAGWKRILEGKVLLKRRGIGEIC